MFCFRVALKHLNLKMMNPSADQEFKMTPMLRYESPTEVNVNPEVQKKLHEQVMAKLEEHVSRFSLPALF